MSQTGSSTSAEVGEVIDWTIRLNNSGPQATGGVLLQDVMSGDHAYVAGSSTYPPNVTFDEGALEWRFDEVYGSPVVNSVPVVVRNVIREILIKNASGDGYQPIVNDLSDALEVYIFNHHYNALNVQCFSSVTGGECAGYPKPYRLNGEDLTSPSINEGVIYRGKIYNTANRSTSGDYGISCWDTAIDDFCIGAEGFVSFGSQNTGSWKPLTSPPEVVDGRVYSVDHQSRIHCFRTGTGNPCAGVTTVIDDLTADGLDTIGAGENGLGQTHGSDIYWTLNRGGRTWFHCINAVTNATCDGSVSWPVDVAGGAGQYGSFLAYVGGGAEPTHLCTSTAASGSNYCLSLSTGAVSNVDDVMGARWRSGLNVQFSNGASGHEVYVSSLSRTYFAEFSWTSESHVMCWDWTTNDRCADDTWATVDGLLSETGGEIYGAGRSDKFRCNFATGDNNVLWNFDDLGNKSCKQREIDFAAFVDGNEYYCRSGVATAKGLWTHWELTTPPELTTAEFLAKFRALTVEISRDPLGIGVITTQDLLADGTAVTIPGAESIASTQRLYYRIFATLDDPDINPFNGDPLARTTFTTDKPIEICLQSVVTSGECGGASGIINDAIVTGGATGSAQVLFDSDPIGGCAEVTLGDRLFNSSMGGATDGGNGINGVPIFLYADSDGDGLFDPDVDQLVEQTVTTGDGQYAFTGVVEGPYCLVVGEDLLPADLDVSTNSGVQCRSVAADDLDFDFGYDQQPVDLSVVKNASPAQAMEDDLVTYSITLTNHNNNVDVPDVTVTDAFVGAPPAAAIYLSSLTTDGTFYPDTGQWTIPVVAAGASETLTLVYRVGAIGSVDGSLLLNRAAITGGLPFGDNPANNSDDASITVFAPLTPPETFCAAGRSVLNFDQLGWGGGLRSTYTVDGVDVRITFEPATGSFNSLPHLSVSKPIALFPGATLSAVDDDGWAVEVEFLAPGTTTARPVNGLALAVGGFTQRAAGEQAEFGGALDGSALTAPDGLAAGPGDVVIIGPATAVANGQASADGYALATWQETSFVDRARVKLTGTSAGNSLSGISFCTDIDPSIGLAKALVDGPVEVVGQPSTYDYKFTFTAGNYGNVPLDNITVVDDFSAFFGVGLTGSSRVEIMAIDVGMSGLTPAPAGAATELTTFITDGTLAVGEVKRFDVSLRFFSDYGPPVGSDPLPNTAVVSGTTTGNITVQDVSDDSADGLNPDPDGNGDPTDNNTPTPVPVPAPPVPGVGLAKQVTSGPTAVMGRPGNYDITFTLWVQNTGNVPLEKLQVTDDLLAAFAPVDAAPLSPELLEILAVEPSPSLGSAAPLFMGQAASAAQLSSPQPLLSGTAELPVGGEGFIRIIARFDSDNFVGPYENSALATATPANGQPDVSDTSTDGADPDPSTAGNDPAENPNPGDHSTPTPFAVPGAPGIGLAKQLTGISGNGDGSFTAAYRLRVANVGNEALSEVRITDDLAAAFPAPAEVLSVSMPTMAGAPFNGAVLTLNDAAAFLTTGFVTTGGDLPVNSWAEIDFAVTFRPNGLASDAFENSAMVTGVGSEGDVVADTSEDRAAILTDNGDGTVTVQFEELFEVDPDTPGTLADQEAAPGDNSDPTPLLLPEQPKIALAKQLLSIKSDPYYPGSLMVEFALAVQNVGDVDLKNVQVTDDLMDTFGGTLVGIPTAPQTSGTLASAGLAFTGKPGGEGLLNAAASMLPVGATETITFVARVNPLETTPANYGPFENSAEATAVGPNGTPTDDLSNDSATLQPDRPDDTPTPITIPRTPGIGLAKSAGPVTRTAMVGVYRVNYTVRVQNIGDVPLDRLQITEDLTATFDDQSDARFVSIQAVGGQVIRPVGGASLAINMGFDGDDAGVPYLLAGGAEGQAGNGLNIGEEALLEFTVLFEAKGSDGGPFNNRAVAFADPVDGSSRTSDISTDGVDPDPDTGGNSPDQNPNPYDNHVPTPVSVPPQGLIGVAKRVSDLGVTDASSAPQGGLPTGQLGSFDVTFELVVTNQGNTELFNVTVEDDLRATFPNSASVVAVTDPIVDGLGLTAANPGYNGTTDKRLLLGTDALPVGGMGTVTFTVRFEPGAEPNPFANTAMAMAIDPLNDKVSDSSTDGGVPDANGNGDARDDDSPTLFSVPELPIIGLAKRLDSIRASVDFPGKFDATFTVAATNLGNTALERVIIVDDLEATFSADVLEAVTVAPVATGDLVATATEFTGRTGGTGGIALTTSASTLAVGATELVTFSVRIDPRAATPANYGPFSNSATVTAHSPGGLVVEDVSNDSATLLADEDGDKDPTEPEDNTPTPIELETTARIALAKAADEVRRTDVAGIYEVGYRLRVQNTGNVPLTGVQISDNMTATYDDQSDAVFLGIVADANGAPVTQLSGAPLPINMNYDGDDGGDAGLLDGADPSNQLDVGEEAVFQTVVRFQATGFDTGPFMNTAVAAGVAANDILGLNPVIDVSQDGEDPDPDTGGNAPSENPNADDNSDPTPVVIAADGVLGLAKAAVATSDASQNPLGGLPAGQLGEFDVTFLFTVANVGTVPLYDVQITDELTDAFPLPITIVAVTDPVVTGALVAPNLNFDGQTDSRLLLETDDLGVGASGTVEVTVRFDPNGAAGPLMNSSRATGIDPSGEEAQDVSQDGLDIDPDGNRDPRDNDEPTPFDFPERPVLGVAKSMAVIDAGPTANGPWRVKIGYRVENLGNVSLTRLSLVDDLEAVFGASGVDWTDLVVNPAITGTATDLMLNGFYVGHGVSPSTELFNVGVSDLAPGAFGQFEIELTLLRLSSSSSPEGLFGDYRNQVEAVALTPSGTEISDLSVDGSGVDPDGDGDPANDDEPSPLVIPNIGVAKRITEVRQREDVAGFEVDFELVVMNSGAELLTDLQIDENIFDQYGPAFLEVLPSSLAVSEIDAGVTLPTLGSFDGGITDPLMFDGQSGHLPSGTAFAVTFSVVVDPAVEGRPERLLNQVLASGMTPSGLLIDDLSDSGVDPQGDNGAGGVDDPTQLALPSIAVAKRAAAVRVLGEGQFEITFHVVVLNDGTERLHGVELLDDIFTQLGGAQGAFIEVTQPPFLITDAVNPNSQISLNADWMTSSSAVDLLSPINNNILEAGDGLTIGYSVVIDRTAPDAPELLTNQVTATGLDPEDTQVTDLSDDGVDPRTDNGTGGVDDPTPLPVVPFGIVYDSNSREPLANIRVTLINSITGMAVDPSCLLTGENPQQTQSDGSYYLTPTFADPSCPVDGAYGIRLDGTLAGYLAVLPDGTGQAVEGGVAPVQPPLDARGCEDSPLNDLLPGRYGCQLQLQPNAPQLGADGLPSTRYHLEFLFGDRPGDVVSHNHIPLDRVPHGAGVVVLIKTALDPETTVGGYTRWQIEGTSTLDVQLANTQLVDALPPGFGYRTGSGRVEIFDAAGTTVLDQKIEPTITPAGQLMWSPHTIPARGKIRVTLDTQTGAGVPLGVHRNKAQLFNLLGELLSPAVHAIVRVRAEGLFDCSDIVGRVFNDKDRDGYPGADEPGIAGVRLVTTGGQSIKVDRYGRFSVPCADIPSGLRGSNFVMKLDVGSLPIGYRLTTENPRVVRLTRGKLTKLNFGASIGRVVRLSLDDQAWVGAGAQLDPRWRQGVDLLVRKATESPSTLRITYSTQLSSDLPQRRLNALTTALRKRLRTIKGADVQIEAEIQRPRLGRQAPAAGAAKREATLPLESHTLTPGQAVRAVPGMVILPASSLPKNILTPPGFDLIRGPSGGLFLRQQHTGAVYSTR